jgi:hypothetical protein
LTVLDQDDYDALQAGEDVVCSTVLNGRAEHVLRLLFYLTPLRKKFRL